MAFKKVGDTQTTTQDKPIAGSATDQFSELKQDVLDAYEHGVTLEDAERKAAKFLYAQITLSGMIQSSDLSARMKKNGYKTARAAAYLSIVQSADKKPTEAQIEATINTDTTVSLAQDSYERSEVEAEALHRLYDIFRDGHIYMRGIAKNTGSY